jgi:hypothetical protein
MCKVFILLIALLYPQTFCYSQTVMPHWDWPVTGDYGPRIVPTPGASWFHQGIDFSAIAGTGIPSLGEGDIVGIDYGGGWYISVQGRNARWTYLHIFDGSELDHAPPRNSGNWELAEAYLTDILSQKTENAPVIVLWSDETKTSAVQVLCTQWGRGR